LAGFFMRIPISLAILGTTALVGAVVFGVWKWRELNPAPQPPQEMTIAREMVGQWRPPGLTCADAVTISFDAGNLTVDYGSQSEDDVQAVAGLEPNGFIRTYSPDRGSRFYMVEGDSLIMNLAEGQRAVLHRCDAAAPVMTAAAAPAPELASPQPPPVQASAEPVRVETPPPAPPRRAPPTAAAHNDAPEQTPAPARTLLAAAPAEATPAPAAAPLPSPVAVAPPLPPITQPVWLARPSAAEVAIFYPERALVRELPGSARLDCVVRNDGSLNCSVQAESPAGYGFGEAALGIAQSFRMAQRLGDGSATEGRHISVPIVFAQAN
jgi:periplasmic protein TonB